MISITSQSFKPTVGMWLSRRCFRLYAFLHLGSWCKNNRSCFLSSLPTSNSFVTINASNR
eukprot:SAG22_NODE_307_length_12666_cov_761.250259_7_plen_60_part_00